MTDDARTFPHYPIHDSEVAIAWADVLYYVANVLGAPAFAADLAQRGISHANIMADRWEDGGFEPVDFAAYLRDYPQGVRKV